MSSISFRQMIEKMLADGLFSGYDKLAVELNIDEEDLRQALFKSEGRNISTLAKLKILALSGVSDLQTAIKIVESDASPKPLDVPYLDSSTGSIRWLDALESLKKSAGLIEDKELAAYLGIPTSTLSDFRRRKADISSRIKLTILDHLGFHRLASGIEFLLRDEAAVALKRARQRQARKLSDQRRVDNEG